MESKSAPAVTSIFKLSNWFRFEGEITKQFIYVFHYEPFTPLIYKTRRITFSSLVLELKAAFGTERIVYNGHAAKKDLKGDIGHGGG